jgi:hypothetical protein
MQPEEMLRLLRRRPFEPFAVHLKDGRVFEIRYPEINLVTRSTFTIGIPVPDDPDPVADRFLPVSWSDISGVEPRLATTPSSND